jgi:histone deacetylase 6
MEDNGGDTFMYDDDVVASTEAQMMNTQTMDGSRFKDDRGSPLLESTQLQSVHMRPSSLPLKGEGIKREAAVFDYPLTKRQDGPRPAKFSPLPYATSQTGLVYDVRMRFHVEPVQTEEDIHPEDPRRIHAIYESFADAGLAWRNGSVQLSNDFYMGRIDTRFVTKDEVCLVHTEKHYNWVQSLRTVSDDELHKAANDEFAEHQQHTGSKMDSVYLSRQTAFCAELSAGGAIEACRAIMLGKVKNAFAIIRPPGHHAEREDAKGFCFFDNVSVALKACQREFGEQCRKVFVLDWDVHHGNGIQQANYDDPNVLYVSLHVHEKGRFYPECSYRDRRGPYGDYSHCGRGAGLGKNVNIPWSKKGMGDADYIYAFQQVVMPIATEFEPDLVIIAAGFDAAEGDMLGGCKVTPAGYAHMTHMLMSLAEGRVAVCLEGGYNLESIAKSATAVARTLMGEPPERLVNTKPTLTGVDDVKMVLRQQSRFWSSLYPKDLSARLAGPFQGVRMHDVVRRWQAETLWDDYEMIPLSVYRNALSQSFKNQVLATYVSRIYDLKVLTDASKAELHGCSPTPGDPA